MIIFAKKGLQILAKTMFLVFSTDDNRWSRSVLSSILPNAARSKSLGTTGLNRRLEGIIKSVEYGVEWDYNKKRDKQKSRH